MKIAIITHYRISHIRPVIPIIDGLIAHGHDVFVFIHKKYSHLLGEKKCEIIEYDDFMGNVSEIDKIENEIRRINDDFIKGSINQTFSNVNDLIMYVSLLKSIGEGDFDRTNIVEKLEKVSPDLILRDSVESSGLYYADLNGIEICTYVTNNIYSFESIFSDLLYFRTYFGLNKINLVSEVDMSLSKYQYSRAFEKLKEYTKNNALYPFFQQFPREKFNIVFSTTVLSLKCEGYEYDNAFILKNRKYFEIDSHINEEEDFFLKYHKKKIAYISAGSYLELSDDHYILLIDYLLQQNYKVIVSKKSKINKYIDNSDVYINFPLNQKRILSFSDIFISTGGYNSLIESLYFGTPLFIIPITGEQRMNGLIVEKLNVGMSNDNIRNEVYSTKKLLDIFIENQVIYRKEIQIIQKNIYDEIDMFDEKVSIIIEKIEKRGQ